VDHSRARRRTPGNARSVAATSASVLRWAEGIRRPHVRMHRFAPQAPVTSGDTLRSAVTNFTRLAMLLSSPTRETGNPTDLDVLAIQSF